MQEETYIPALKPGLEMAKPGEPQPELDAVARKLYEDTAPKTVQIQTDRGAGSGAFIDKDGRITTAAHVILGSREQSAVTQDGTVYKLMIEKLDDINDTAILKPLGIKAGRHPHIELSPSAQLKADDAIYAVGHPQGMRPAYMSPGYFRKSVSMENMFKGQAEEAEQAIKDGLENLTPRELPYMKEALAREILGGKIHIRPGNSGGPAVNAEGKMIGQSDLITSFEDGYFVPSERIMELYKNESKFDFKYNRLAEPWAQEYKNTWKQSPTTAASMTLAAGGAGYLGYNVLSRFPKSMGVGLAAVEGLRLLDDSSKLLSATDPMDKVKYGIASVSDLSGLAGGLAMTARSYRLGGAIGLGIGIAGRVAADFIPNRLVLSDITRKSDSLMPPLDPQIDRTLRLGSLER